tara:strand:+ start:239 stop:340 length:102 start_codon:yes stop_codon:yes gene_type:complete
MKGFMDIRVGKNFMPLQASDREELIQLIEISDS